MPARTPWPRRCPRTIGRRQGPGHRHAGGAISRFRRSSSSSPPSNEVIPHHCGCSIEAAAALVRPRLDDFEKLWRDGPVAAVERTEATARRARERIVGTARDRVRRMRCPCPTPSGGSAVAGRSAPMSTLAERATAWADGAWDEGARAAVEPARIVRRRRAWRRDRSHMVPQSAWYAVGLLARGDTDRAERVLSELCALAVRPARDRMGRNLRPVRRMARATRDRCSRMGRLRPQLASVPRHHVRSDPRCIRRVTAACRAPRRGDRSSRRRRAA